MLHLEFDFLFQSLITRCFNHFLCHCALDCQSISRAMRGSESTFIGRIWSSGNSQQIEGTYIMLTFFVYFRAADDVIHECHRYSHIEDFRTPWAKHDLLNWSLDTSKHKMKFRFPSFCSREGEFKLFILNLTSVRENRMRLHLLFMRQ